VQRNADVELAARLRVYTVMRKAIRLRSSLTGMAVLLIGLHCQGQSAAAAVQGDAAAPADVEGAWQHHRVSFTYVGFTTLYTCEGLEDHVRQILLYLGARKDVHVTASGCPGPFNAPSHSAFVDAEFNALAPAADAPAAAGAAASATVKGRWTALEVTSRRPSFMGDGDCELVQEMKDLITKSFSLRNVEYRTQCFPHDVTLDEFSVKGQALRAVPQVSDAVRG
jgi:hypothetical protein